MPVDFKKYIMNNWRIIILSILGIIFLFIYTWFPYQISRGENVKFPSPDGTANYFWAERYAAGKDLFYFEPLNLIADDVIVPRSVRSDNGEVKPVSFLGLILIYGWIAKIFGSWIIIYLTPLLAVIGVLFFYGVIKRVFNEKIAFVSALMFLCLAPYWYYASRSMFHNVLFIDLVLAGAWMWIYAAYNGTRIKRIKRMGANYFLPFLSGAFIGLAIITRASELIWLAPAILLAWAMYFKQIQWDKLTLFACGVFLALMPMFYYNQILYGDFLKFGYNKPVAVETQSEIVVNNIGAENIDGIATPPRSIAGLFAMTNKFIPAQINIKQAGKSFIYYYVIMFWHLFWPALFGGIWFLWNYKKQNKGHWLYFASFILVSVILVLYYGSWEIYDNPDKSSVTIGNSYTRYFLPMYIMSIPLAVLFIVKLSELLKKKYLIYGLQIVAIIAFFILNFQIAALCKEEGLLSMKNSLEEGVILGEEILPHIEPEAIIISERFDKIFWPERKVIVGNFTGKEHNLQYQKLIEYGTPLYYYGFIFPEVDMNYLNDRRLKEHNLKIEPIKLSESNRLGLYKLVKIPSGQ
ncbi:MAG: hypothetical protein WC323_04050 [Patescibacteria group bacterium]|jgi:hypothetical protein